MAEAQRAAWKARSASATPPLSAPPQAVDRLDALDPKANRDATYEACGSATCSSIRISGIDREALRQQAKALGYVNERRSAGKAKQCKKHAAAKADGAADDDGAGDGGGGR